MKSRFPLVFTLLAAFFCSAVSTKAQCPAGTVNSGFNMVNNGTFEAGNTGFQSGYTPCSAADCLYNQVYYAVGTDPSFYHGNFEGTDHTSGSGNFLIVNGAYTPGIDVWCETFTVQPNTTYLLSTWVTSVNASNPAILQFTVNGSAVGSTFNAPAFTFGFFWPGWTQYNTSWFSGSNTTATLCITNQNTAVGGNDFGLDDISFVPCVCTFSTQPIPSATICTGQNTTLTASAGATSYQWFPSTGLSCTTCQSVLASPSFSTTYTMVATGPGCSDTAITTVSVWPQPNANAGNNITICAGQSTTLQGSGGPSYAWSPSTGLSSTSIASPVATPTVSTTYTLTVTGGGGCTASDQVIVAVQPAVNLSVSNDTSVCAGSPVNLSATGGASYVWSPSATLACSTCASTTATPLTNTTYTVIAGATGCSDTASISVTVFPQPVADAGNDTVICEGTSMTLQGSGGPSYAWSPSTNLSSTNIANPIANPSVTITYTLTVSGAGGCSSTDQVVVAVQAIGSLTVSNDTFVCEGGSVPLTASGATNYSWTPSATLSCSTCAVTNASPTTTTTYTIIGGTAGCADTLSTIVTVYPQPTANAGNDTSVCGGSSVLLQGSGTDAITFAWSPSAGLSSTSSTNPLATPTVTTTYTLTVTGSGGCSASDQVVITLLNGGTPVAGNDTSVCEGNSVSLTASGATSYTWSPSTDIACSTCATTTATPTVTTTYTVVTSANGCNDTLTVDVTVFSVPIANAGNDTVACVNQPITLLGTGGVGYSWSPSASLSSSTVSSPIATLTTTTTFTLTVTSVDGCTATDDLVVTVLNSGVATAGNDTTVCEGNPINLFANGATTYVWSPSTDLACSTCNVTTANPSTNTTYTVIASSAGCSDTLSVAVTVLEQSIANAGNDISVCGTETFTLQGSGGPTYAWSPSTGLSATNVANPTGSLSNSTTYVLTVDNGTGCSDTDTMSVTVDTIPIASITADTGMICIGDDIDLVGAGGDSYVWSPSVGLENETAQTTSAIITSDVTYTLTTTDANGCSDTAQIQIDAVIPQHVIAPFDTLGCYGQPLTLTASGVANYSWNGPNASCANCPSLVIPAVIQNGVYTVTGVDTSGCETNAQVTVIVDNTCELVVFPNIFSPNGDNINDFFFPVTKSIENVRFYVYNRWGQMVFDGLASQGWNGTYKGNPAPIASYVWFATALTSTGRTLHLTGNVSLVR